MAKEVAKGVLKARMLEYFREVEATGEELVVTSRGKPVLRVVPYRQVEAVETVFSDVRGQYALPEDSVLHEGVAEGELGESTFGDSELEELL